MNEKVRKHVVQYYESEGGSTDDATIIETITDVYPYLHREEIGNHRWWNDYFYVVEIDGMLIGYVDAEANRDESVYDLGYEFDPSSICEVRSVEKTVVTYEPI